MVHFVSSEGSASGDGLAPVTYLPGAVPGMKRRSPLNRSVSSGVEVGPGRFTAATDADADGDGDGDADDADADRLSSGDADPEAERLRAENVLLNRLRGRSLSLAEARAVLVATEIGDAAVEEIIERFRELHYIDEEKLADQILRSHHERKGLGRTAVEAELRRRKISLPVILEKLDEIPDDDEERAVGLALKRIQQLSRLDDDTADRRLTGFLLRKGYSSGAVRVAVKAALASRGRGTAGSSTVRFR